MTINLNATPDYAVSWLIDWAKEAAQQEKEEAERRR